MNTASKSRKEHCNTERGRFPRRKEKIMKKAIKKFFEEIAYILGFGGKTRRQTVDDGICDFSGQGRDKYGR